MQLKNQEGNYKSKSYKRELAIVLLIWFGYLVETKDESLIEVLVWPVFTYSALAFGIDWYGKTGKNVQSMQNQQARRPDG